MSDRLKIGQEVLIHGYIDEIRKDTVIIRNDGGYFGTVEYEITDIEMPDTNDVLDKIRAEIEEQVLESLSDGGDDWFTAEKVNECLEIIDKYKAESEE